MRDVKHIAVNRTTNVGKGNSVVRKPTFTGLLSNDFIAITHAWERFVHSTQIVLGLTITSVVLKEFVA